MIIDHIGIVVKSLDKAIEYWSEVFGYEQKTHVVENTRQKVFVVFMYKDNSLPIKLISPVNHTSPVYRFAQKGGGIHHLCFDCNELDEELVRLRNLKLRVLTSPEPGEAFQDEKIAFLHARHLGNIELIDTKKRCFLKTFKENIQDENA